jgi:5-amino-6-(5-phosphoribosylamino)uracil reductase
MKNSREHYPVTILSVAMSLDGYIAHTSHNRLILSNAEDLDAIDALRAQCDAILVGANTVRLDNPRLVIRSDARRAQRQARGLAADPMKITLTQSGSLDPNSSFFLVGDAIKIVYCEARAASDLQSRLGNLATVVATDATVSPTFILPDLYRRGVRRLLIEGGSKTHSLFLSAGVVDEIRLAVAPIFVAEESAPRFTGFLTKRNDRRPTLRSVEQFGDMAVMWYAVAPLKSESGGRELD